MPIYFFFHPALGLVGVAFTLTALALQMGRRKLSAPHYAVGLLAVAAVFLARTAAFWTIRRIIADGISIFEVFTLLGIHGTITFLMLVFLLVQAGLGLTMYFFKRSVRQLLPFHRSNAYIVVGLAMITLIMGTTTFVMLWLQVDI